MPEPSPSRKRRGRLLRSGAACVVLTAVAGYVAVQYVTGGAGDPGCRVVSAEGGGPEYEFTPEQAVNAATIAAVGTDRGMPQRAVTIALATALQESALRNLGHGDRDSLGLFQQRPSQGWGTERQVTNPTYAADVFYAHLAKVRDYTELPLTVAAQRVQRSGYPEAYAKHEPDATLLAAALTGTSAATLTCEGVPASATATGPEAVRAALARDFGREAAQRARAEGARSQDSPSDDSKAGDSKAGDSKADDDKADDDKATGADVPAAETSGRTVTLPLSEGGSTGGRAVGERGWQLAHWAVANASALHIERVVYAGREWTAGHTDSRWRPAEDSGTEAAGVTGTGSSAGSGANAVRIVTAR
ncbi:heavy metal transporter [Streptomyces sp. NPDC006172]|uniref:heavy metal transporter n=1 Tax=Streptomyces sp. NPDC006172 TaxID=3154470 RepID=UPI0033ECE3B3